MTTGIAVSVDAAISAPQSVLPARAEEVREPDRDRLLRLVVQEDAGEDVLVPAS